jgi:hypothetical protein
MNKTLESKSLVYFRFISSDNNKSTILYRDFFKNTSSERHSLLSKSPSILGQAETYRYTPTNTKKINGSRCEAQDPVGVAMCEAKGGEEKASNNILISIASLRV